MSLPQWVVDRIESLEPSPLDAMIAAEDADRAAKIEAEMRRQALLPCDRHPTKLLMGVQSWPVPDDAQGFCGTCHGLPLPPGTYCLCCDMPKGSLAGLAKYQPKLVADTDGKDGRRKKGAKPETRKEKRAKKNRREAA